MFASLITIVAALVLACASPHAEANVRAERVGVSFADIANSAAPETALPAQTACKSKTAPPARASLEYPASGENAALNHWHTWGNPLSPEKPTSGNRDWLWDSAPFGDTAANEQPTAGIPNFTFNLRFRGQQYDRETGTHYNYFRDYEAQSGRYVQSDPVGLAGGMATFTYVSNSPLDASDYFGLRRGGVYILTDPKTGVVTRSGRTNDLDRRQGEHGRAPETCGLDFSIVAETDVYDEQRGVEQLTHDAYGKPVLNKLEPISPKNKKSEQSIWRRDAVV